MKKILKQAAAVLAALILTVTWCPLTSPAASTYTVTFRAGNAGSFDVEKVETAVKMKSLVSVKSEYIKLTASRGQSMEEVFYRTFGRVVAQTSDFNALFSGFLKENKEYTMLSEASWGPEASDRVRHNEEYVLDYGVLVDPVPYSVTFVDKESGEAVAAPIMGYGSEGERITFAPVTVEEYESDDSEESMVLSKDSENTLTFSYKYTGVTYIPGKTTVRTVYDDTTNVVTTTVQMQNPANTGNGQMTDGTGANGQQQNPAGTKEKAQPADQAGENGDVPPLPETEQDGNIVGDEIEDEKVPLASVEKEDYKSWIVYVLIGSVAVLVVAAVVIYRKKKS